MTEHTVKTFDTDLANLRHKISVMCDLVEREWTETIDALFRRNEELSRHTVVFDTSSDAMQREIEEAAVALIARRQPVAHDLRFIVAVWETAIELNRIGELAKSVADRDRGLQTGAAMPAPARGLRRLLRVALRRLHDAIDGLVSGDTATATALWSSDVEIDALYGSLCRELLTYMMAEPKSSPAAVHLLFCAKCIESIGDHVTNIADAVHYLVAGRRLAGAVATPAA